MKIGICLPYMKRDFDRETILAWIRRIEEAGFSSITCGERITGYTYEFRMLLAAAAAVTERVRIVPSLYVMPMHNAVWAAKEIATLDQLSGGRVTLTVGVGGRENDYRAVNASFKNRHARMDEQIKQMRRIWAGEVPFDGADEVGPDPVQKGGPPILAGAMGPKAITRASRWADGLYSFSMNGEKEEISRMLTMADDAWELSQRDQPPTRVCGFWYSLADDAESRLKNYVFDYMKNLGTDVATSIADTMTRHTPNSIMESVQAMEALNCEELMLVPATADLTELDRLVDLVGDYLE